MISANVRYELCPAVVSQSVGGETVIIDMQTETYFGLNGVGSVVWSLLAGSASVQEIVDVVVDRFDVTTERAVADIRRLLDELEEAGLVGAPSEASAP